MEFRKILCTDVEQHLAFFRFVDTIFGGGRAGTWATWRDRGGWTGDYEVFALVDGGRIVSTVGRSRMHLVVNGVDRTGWQLGAVATARPYRRQGLARRLMDRVIAELDEPDQPVILFANNSVLDFYPRFDFKRIPQRRSVARAALQPSGSPAPRCDLSDASHRIRLARLCAAARPIPGPLAARDYGWLALWNLTCGPVAASWLPGLDAAVATVMEGERLIVHDVIATRPFDLRPVALALIARPVAEVEFLFNPEGFWPEVTHPDADDADLVLFARGAAASLDGPAQLPGLAHT